LHKPSSHINLATSKSLEHHHHHHHHIRLLKSYHTQLNTMASKNMHLKVRDKHITKEEAD